MINKNENDQQHMTNSCIFAVTTQAIFLSKWDKNHKLRKLQLNIEQNFTTNNFTAIIYKSLAIS